MTSGAGEVSGAGEAHGVGVIACGALATHIGALRDLNGWDLTIYPLNPLLHNTPAAIAGEVERLAGEVSGRHTRLAVGYADCGTYGALDALCARLGIARLPGLHCYDLYAGAPTIEALLAEAPGTYVLTDFLVKSFARTVIAELGLDRYPELRDDYFKHYTQVVWLSQTTDPVEQAHLRTLAEEAAQRIGLPLRVRQTGLGALAAALAGLVTPAR